MEYARFKVNQDIILKNPEGKVLILQQNDLWKLPGGHLEEQETWEQGLRREIQEETGITDVTIQDVVRVGMSDSKNTYLITFFGTTSALEVVLDSEHSAFEWVDTDTIDTYHLFFTELQSVVKQYL